MKRKNGKRDDVFPLKTLIIGESVHLKGLL